MYFKILYLLRLGKSVILKDFRIKLNKTIRILELR